ncbi:MAG: quinol:cytochrome C oxidoreductase [Planctomycetes bacterium]|nr:quinol:cytochrome C oxidoreductase [Planctomycetota bacterium]
MSFCFCLSLSLGGLFFTILQHLTRAGWSVVVRRVAENVAGVLPVLAVLSLPIVVAVAAGWPDSIKDVYEWRGFDPAAHVAEATPAATAHHLLLKKQAFLNPTFFTIRIAGYFIIWWWLVGFFRGNSIRQDETGDPGLTSAMQSRSALSMVLFALTTTFAAVDFLMTLDPLWFSTIFGVYFFSGGNVGFFSLLALTMCLLHRAGRAQKALSIEHFHDVGKLMFAFIVFWAYIGFSQYMLIWYANLPEETGWYLIRQEGSWKLMSLFLLLGHFVAPFLALVSRWPKRDPSTLIAAAAWMLLMHWFDMFWLVFPHAEQSVVSADPRLDTIHAAALVWTDGLQCVTCLLGVGGIFVWKMARNMASASLIPTRDPRLHESLAFENI